MLISFTRKVVGSSAQWNTCLSANKVKRIRCFRRSEKANMASTTSCWFDPSKNMCFICIMQWIKNCDPTFAPQCEDILISIENMIYTVSCRFPRCSKLFDTSHRVLPCTMNHDEITARLTPHINHIPLRGVGTQFRLDSNASSPKLNHSNTTLK